MSSSHVKEELHEYLRGARETLVWKLDSLSEYDIRRPMTPTGTNLLGLVKHSTATHLGYFGEVFGRSTGVLGARFSHDGGPAAEFWATPEETREDIVDGYRAAWEFSDATIGDVALDTVGHVWWWGDAPVTLHHAMVHVTVDTQRHAGHADILRELIDGQTGLLRGADNLHIHDPAARQRFCERVEAAAAEFR
ncbi:MAG: DinB family protein [Ilumatobacteraceae bacterium]